MKLFFKFFMVLTFIYSNNFSQWERQTNGLPSNYGTAWAIDACDNNNAIISVLYNGDKLYRTSDGGNLWQPIAFDINGISAPIDVEMINPAKYICVSDTKILLTTNHGENWSIVFDDPSKTSFMNYIEMFDENNGIAMGDAKRNSAFNDVFFKTIDFSFTGTINVGWAVASDGKIFRSLDNGISWIELESGTTNDLKAVYFVNLSVGWVVGKNNTILKTTNGGNTWIKQTNSNYAYYDDVHFINSDIGWIIGDRTIFKTNNGGNTWVLNLAGESIYNNIQFVNANTGYVSGYDNSILKTTNGGANWTKKNIASENQIFITSMQFVNENLGWITGYSDKLFKTTDGGNNWQEINTHAGHTLYDLNFIDNNHGWASGLEGIAITTDGGESWVYKGYSNSSYIRKINFIDSETGLAFGDDLTIYRTEDAGNNWDKMEGLTKHPGLFLKTTDGGNSWVQSNTNSSFSCFSGDTWRRIDFVNSNAGYFYASGISPQALYKTNDGGASWNVTNYTGYSAVLKAYDENICLTYTHVSNNPVVININRTTDGGNSWESFTTEANGWGNDIEFIPGNPNLVWMTGGYNLFYSNDMGEEWVTSELADRPASATIRDIVFTDTNNGWVLCDDGFLYHTSNNGGMSTTDLNDEVQLNLDFVLNQNYPNPFNPSTTISFKLPNYGNAKLMIYDAIGRYIKTLFDKEFSAGAHEYNFNAENLASGVYFYRLQSGKYSQTKKLLLVR